MRLRRHKHLSDPVSVVSRFVDAANRHDAEGIAKCLHPEFESIQPIYPTRNFRGAAQVRRNWQAIFESEPGFRLSLVRSASLDNTVWVELHGAGADVEVAGVFIMGVEGDLVRWARVYSSVVEQVGPRVAPPDPETAVVAEEATTLKEEAARIRQQVDAGRLSAAASEAEPAAVRAEESADQALWADDDEGEYEDDEDEFDEDADGDAGDGDDGDELVAEAEANGDVVEAVSAADATVAVAVPQEPDVEDEDDADDEYGDDDEFDDDDDDEYDDDEYDDEDEQDEDEQDDEQDDDEQDDEAGAAPAVTAVIESVPPWGGGDVQDLVGGAPAKRRWRRRSSGQRLSSGENAEVSADIVDLTRPRPDRPER